MAAAAGVKSETLGNVVYYLNDLNKQNDDFFVEQSKASPNVEIDEYLKAAREVSIALNNMRHFCEQQGITSSLLEKVSATVKDQLTELTEIVTILKAKPKESIPSIIERAQKFTPALNLAAWQPKVTQVSPIVYVVQNCFDAVIGGLFTHAVSTKKFTLTIPNCTIEQKKSKSDELSFKVTAEKDFFPESAKLNHHFFKGVLDVDYKGWKGVYQAKYELWFITYPLCLGLECLFVQKSVKEILRRPFRSAVISLDRRGFKAGTEIVRKQTIFPSEGWKISGQVHLKSINNKCSKGTLLPNDGIMITLTLPKDETDQVWTWAEFEEYQEVIEEKPFKSSLAIPWWESSDFKADQFQLTFTHKGIRYTITQKCEPNDFLKVEKTGDNTYKITAQVPK